MIVIYEHLKKEANIAAEAIKEIYNTENKIIEYDLGEYFKKIDKTDQYLADFIYIKQSIQPKYPNEHILIITDKDFKSCCCPNITDDWYFGFADPYEPICLVSNARLKGKDSMIRSELDISEELYIKRLKCLVIHEVGHLIIEPKQQHYKYATWISPKGEENPLGKHCDDNGCAMYEASEIKSPDEKDGYIVLGGENVYYTGLDDILERMETKGYNWLCPRCKQHIEIDKENT